MTVTGIVLRHRGHHRLDAVPGRPPAASPTPSSSSPTRASSTARWAVTTARAPRRHLELRLRPRRTPAPPRPCSPPSWTTRDCTHVVFGDNAAGRIPPVNAEFYVTYRYGVGAAANASRSTTLSTIIACRLTSTPACRHGHQHGVARSAAPTPRRSTRCATPSPGWRPHPQPGRHAQRLRRPGDAGARRGQERGLRHRVHGGARADRPDPDGRRTLPRRMACGSASAVEAYMSDKILDRVDGVMRAADSLRANCGTDIYIRVTVHVNPRTTARRRRSQVDAVLRNALRLRHRRLRHPHRPGRSLPGRAHRDRCRLGRAPLALPERAERQRPLPDGGSDRLDSIDRASRCAHRDAVPDRVAQVGRVR